MKLDTRATRVLVADDEEEILELLGEYLNARGYQVLTAYDGEDALQMVRSGPVDIVLTDMKMPNMGGLELLRETQRLPQPVAVIVMTGFATVETAINALKIGAYDYLLKPFKLRDVHAALVRASERLRREREAARTRELLSFYELAQSVDSLGALPRLYGLLAAVALRETASEEVAIWLREADGWSAVARGGVVRALSNVRPADIVAAETLDKAITMVPFSVGDRRVGVVAVAGGDARTPLHQERLRILAAVVSECMARVGWTPPN